MERFAITFIDKDKEIRKLNYKQKKERMKQEMTKKTKESQKHRRYASGQPHLHTHRITLFKKVASGEVVKTVTST